MRSTARSNRKVPALKSRRQTENSGHVGRNGQITCYETKWPSTRIGEFDWLKGVHSLPKPDQKHLARIVKANVQCLRVLEKCGRESLQYTIAKDQHNKLKEKLPSHTVYGIAPNGRKNDEIEQYNGVMFHEVDHCGDRQVLKKAFEKVRTD